MDKDEIIRRLLEGDIKNTAQFHILRAMKKWGVERTEEKIKELYSAVPKLRDTMLKEYNNLVRGEK